MFDFIKLSIALTLAWLSIAVPTKAQSADSLQIEQSVRQVLVLKRAGKYADAHTLADSFYEALSTTRNNDYFKGKIIFVRGRVEIDLGDYDASILSANESIKHFSLGNHLVEIAGSYNLMGVGFYFKNKLDSTLVYYNKSFRLKQKLNVGNEALAISAYNLGIVYEDTGKFEEAIERYRTAAEYLTELEDEKFLADVYLGIANTYRHMRDYANSRQYADLALTKAILRYGEDNPAITFFYVSYSGVLSVLEEYDKAAIFLNRTVALRNTFYGKNHLWTAEAHLNLGKLSRKIDDFDQAEQSLQTAINIKKENNNIYSTIAQFQLAQLYEEHSVKTNLAIELTVKYIDEITKIYGQQNRDVAAGYLLLARTTSDSSRFYNNLNQSRQAANYNKEKLHESLAPYVCLESLLAESDYLASHCTDSCGIEILQTQYDLIPHQVALIQNIYNSYSSEGSKIELGKYCKDIIAHGISICYQLYQHTQATIYIEKALELSELNRNTILLKGIQENRFRVTAGVDSVDIKSEKRLMERNAAIQLSIAYERTSGDPSIESLNELYEERSHIRQSQDSLNLILEDKYPRLKALRYLQVDVDFAHLQSTLLSDQQVITFFLGAASAYVFSITSKQVLFIRLNDVIGIKKTITALEQGIISRLAIDSLSSQLYTQVLSGVSIQPQYDLVFILDNILNAVPFEILIDQAGSYLIQSHAIRYAGSLQLFNQINESENESPMEWIGFSPSYDGELALFNTKPEIEEISRMYTGTVFTDSLATREQFLVEVGHADMLHLAMHTEIDNINPMLSRLLFYEQPLYASEIYNQKIPASMVVLSACESGRGKLESGEGVMSLSRAFSYAGVPAMVMSLWKIPDMQTPKIMVPFYKHLKSGKSKSHALRLAKLEYLKNTKQATFKHPFYWAGFVLNGDDTPMKKSKKPWYVFIGLASCLLLLFFVVKRWKL